MEIIKNRKKNQLQIKIHTIYSQVCYNVNSTFMHVHESETSTFVKYMCLYTETHTFWNTYMCIKKSTKTQHQEYHKVRINWKVALNSSHYGNHQWKQTQMKKIFVVNWPHIEIDLLFLQERERQRRVTELPNIDE